ncbi:aldehyde dehydrogenase [Halomicroarcula sp. GCM10025817]|uniref:aldehyde dehydrogenase n=1 Tax=Haloarcula TaxID=2237 RepID=UPI0023E7C724|nr:aldehyde dehydrogenase [Halomicroarcula sp. SYNS111]
MSSQTLYVDGQWIEAANDERIEVLDPATEEVAGTIANATESEVLSAVEAANEAQKEWGLRPAPERGQLVRDIADVLMDHQEELAELIMAEQGKPRGQAMGEVASAADMSNYMAEWDRRIEGDVVPGDFPSEKLTLERRPHGVVAGIIPWNYPIALFMRKTAPALVTGNTMVAKPSSNTPLATVRAVELIDEHVDLPDGVVNLVTGHGSTVGDTLVTADGVDMVTMTGDTGTGKAINESVASSLKPVSLELGGKAPAIVWKDANLEAAVEDVLTARIANTGQVCTCAERIYVHSDVAEEFTDRLVEAAEDVVVGDPRDDPDMGPQVSAAELEATENAVKTAVDQGATLRTGGSPPEGEQFDHGYWYRPTVLTDVTQDMDVIQEEVFGPVSPVVEVDSMDQAIEYANESKYGLSSYLFTNNYQLVNRVIDELEFGETYVNRSIGESWQGHHIGWDESGLGGEDGKYGMLKYTQLKTIYHNYENPAGSN